MATIAVKAAKKSKGSKWITVANRYQVYCRDNFRCYACGLDMVETPHLLSLDHIVCQSTALTVADWQALNVVDNVVTCCFKCNNKRRDKGIVAIFGSEAEDRALKAASQPISKAIRQASRKIRQALAKGLPLVEAIKFSSMPE